MLRCRECDCICDPSDLVNGVCDDCRGKKEKQREAEELIILMQQSQFEQLELEEIK